MKKKNSGKSVGKRAKSFRWIRIAEYSHRLRIDVCECHEMWSRVCERIDEYSRVCTAEKWRRVNTFDFNGMFNIVLSDVASTRKALESGYVKYRTSPGDMAWLERAVRTKFMVKYRCCSMPEHSADRYMEDDDSITREEAEQMAFDANFDDEFPDIPLAELKRLSAVPDVRPLMTDGFFLDLAAFMFSKASAEIVGVSHMVMKECEGRYNVEDALAELFLRAAIRAKSIGDEQLARRFVEARNLLDRGLHFFRSDLGDEEVEYVVETYYGSFNELQRAIAVAELPAWKKKRAK